MGIVTIDIASDDQIDRRILAAAAGDEYQQGSYISFESYAEFHRF